MDKCKICEQEKEDVENKMVKFVKGTHPFDDRTIVCSVKICDECDSMRREANEQGRIK